MGRTDYEATNRIGTVVRTFATRDQAIQWVKANLSYHDGLHVVEAITTVLRRRVYKPRSYVQRTGDLVGAVFA